MATLDLFEKIRVSQIASSLDLHPFEVARLLGQVGGMPHTLAFEEADIERVRELAGVETWWGNNVSFIEDGIPGRGLVRNAAQMLLDREVVGDNTTRADNLFRGLDPADQFVVRRAVNHLIRDEVLTSIPTSQGLHLRVDTAKVSILQGIADGSDIPSSLEELWS
jgi:hypothetical protein